MAFLVIEGLRKYYGELIAVDLTRLEVVEGEFISLLGPSGCGKTTTLHCIAGLVEPDAGSIWIGGRNVTQVPVHHRNLGMVFQNYALFPHMTVFQNVAYGLENRRTGSDETSRLASEALDLVELSGYEHRYPHQLSGGQQQRVALARAVVYRPNVLLLDEPLSNLDAKLRKSMRSELRRLQRQLNITTVFVTHDQLEALSLSDRVAVMNGGRIEQIGTPSSIYERPATLFVADFMGTSNLIRGTVSSYDPGSREARASVAGGALIAFPCQESLREGAQVQLTIKPERISISREGSGVQGVVMDSAYLGSLYSYRVQLGEAYVEVADHRTAAPFEVGETVNLNFDPHSLVVVGT